MLTRPGSIEKVEQCEFLTLKLSDQGGGGFLGTQYFFFCAFRPVARGCGGATHPPNLPKGPLLSTKWAKNGFFVVGEEG